MRSLRALICLAALASACEPSGDPARPPEGAEPVEPELAKAPVTAPEAPEPTRDGLEEACGSGDAQACFTLSEMLENGEGGPEDPERARLLREQACAAGSLEACDAMGH